MLPEGQAVQRHSDSLVAGEESKVLDVGCHASIPAFLTFESDLRLSLLFAWSPHPLPELTHARLCAWCYRCFKYSSMLWWTLAI